MNPQHRLAPSGGLNPLSILRCLPLLGLVFLGLDCDSDPLTAEAPCEPRPINALFFGNSFTLTYDVPGAVAALIDSAGLGPLEYQQFAVGGYGLQDHWVNRDVQRYLTFEDWDLIVLQQGPSATEGRPSLLEYTALFAGAGDSIRADVALYMVWPSLDRFFDFDGVYDSYRTAAESVGGLFFPAGEAWRVAWESDSTLALYGRDDFHPSQLGTYLAALVMFEQITGCSPVGLPARFKSRWNSVYDLDPEVALQLQLAAEEANRRHAIRVPGWPPGREHRRF